MLTPALWHILWDPTQPVATRPLAIQKSGTWYCYGWDLTKNICEVFGSNGYINTIYTYTPCGEVTANGNVTQPIQWSSEFYDAELGLVYYNYRHYNSTGGRWVGRDSVEERDSFNLYSFLKNKISSNFDKLGLENIKINDCVQVCVEINSRGFWGNTRTPISDGNTLIVKDGFNVIITPLWIQNSTCKKDLEKYKKCFPYSIEASLKIENKSWTSGFTGSKYRTIMGLLDRNEISRGDVVFSGSSALYVMGNNFYVPRKDLVVKGKMTLEIYVIPGDFRKILSYKFSFRKRPR